MKKKLIILIISMIFITGCSGNIEVHFNSNDIIVNLETNFNSSELKNNYLSEHMENYNEINPDNYVKEAIDNRIIPAYKKGLNDLFTLDDYQNNSGNYYLKYSYKYNYVDFKNNYIFNSCFDNFIFKETIDEYYYELKGHSNCYYNNMNFIVVSDFVSTQNANEYNSQRYIWKINEKDNDIKFSISKKGINKANDKIVNLVFVIIGLSSIIFGIYTYIRVKNNK